MNTPRIVPLIAPLCLLATALMGCGAAPGPRSAPPPALIEMEPVLVETDGAGEATVYDAAGLFAEGEAAHQAQAFDRCDATYATLLEKFPESRFVHAALYNRGLCLEALKQHAMAAQHFRRHAQLSTELRDRRDGEFRMGFNLLATGNYAEALHLYDTLLAAEDLAPADRAECHLRRAIARTHLKRVGLAERDLRAARSYVEEAYGEHLQGNELLAEVHFRRGEIYQTLTAGVPLKLPLDKMKGDLAEKVRFFRQAQASFIDSLNVRHSYWATASGLKLGDLYERFYTDVLTADTPEDFDKQTKAYYLFELRKALTPLLEQSLSIYEKNITLSERLGARNEWVDETEARVGRLRHLIEVNQRASEPDALSTDVERKPAG